MFSVIFLGGRMYDIFQELITKKGIKVAEVSKATGIRSGVFSDWKKGRYTPKADKMKLIADYLGVSVEYLTTGKKDDENGTPYYLNDDARDLAEFLFNNPEYKVLFDASRKVKKEDIDFVREMIDRANR